MTRNVRLEGRYDERIMSYTSIIERDAFERGVQTLDANKPGWAQYIHVPSLHMDDTCFCVLGQLYGRWSDGVSHLRLYPIASWWGVDAGDDISFYALQMLWTNEILARQALKE